MKAHFIPADGYSIAFFPESKRFFRVNSKAKKLIRAIEKNEAAGAAEKLGLSDEEVKTYTDKIIECHTLPTVHQKAKDSYDKKAVHHLTRLVLHVTNDCNMRCKYCYANGGTYNSDRSLMSREVLDQTLDFFYSKFASISYIQFFGGEPLMNLDLIEYTCEKVTGICEDREEKTAFAVVINGSLISQRFIDLVNKYSITVTVSYDGNRAVNDIVRPLANGNGSSDLVLKKVNWLKEETGQPVTIEATYNKYHVENGIDVVDAVRDIKASVPNVGVHLVPAGGDQTCDFALQDLGMFPKSVHQIMEAYFGNNGEDTSVPMYSLASRIFTSLENPATNSALVCDAGLGTISVSTVGDVYPCFMFTDQEDLCYGNVWQDDLFESARFARIQNKLAKIEVKDRNPQCNKCHIKRICNGCLGLNSFQSGDPFKLSKPLCDMFRNMVDAALIEYVKVNDMQQQPVR